MVQSGQSRFTLLAAQPLSAARAGLAAPDFPTAPLKTRVRSSALHPSGRRSRGQRRRPGTTTGSTRCDCKTAAGRREWPNRDPIGEKGGINLYEVARNGPVDYIDAAGENPLVLIIVGVGAWFFGSGCKEQEAPLPPALPEHIKDFWEDPPKELRGTFAWPAACQQALTNCETGCANEYGARGSKDDLRLCLDNCLAKFGAARQGRLGPKPPSGPFPQPPHPPRPNVPPMPGQ